MNRRQDTRGGLHLVPMLGLTALLIPCVVLVSRLASVAVFEGEPPGLWCCLGEASPPEQLVIAITPEGHDLRGAADVIGDFDGPVIPCLREECATHWDYDWEALRITLQQVKEAQPERSWVTVTPSRTTSYEVLVTTIDIAEGNGHLFPRVQIGLAGP